MDNTVSIAAIGAIVALGTILAPLFLSWLQSNQRRLEKEQDWIRQDIVADKVEIAAYKLAEDNREFSEKLIGLDAGQKQIHALVNSNLREALDATLTAKKATLTVMLRLQPTPADLADIVTLRKEISDRTLALAERDKATAAAASKISDDRTILSG